MEMEIQRKQWTSRYEKSGVNCGICALMRINSMHGSRSFCQGGPDPTALKQPGRRFFFVCLFFRIRPQIILQFRLK